MKWIYKILRFLQKKKTDYEYWKDGEKLVKAPWVLKYYQGITDINQYKLGKKVTERKVLIMSVVCFCFGVYIGYVIQGG